MSLESKIRNRLDSLRSVVTTVYSRNGEVHQEMRDSEGKSTVKKLEYSSPGYVIDEVPDLSVSKILPWLYLGAQDVIFDYELLNANNITHILSIGIAGPSYPGIINIYVEAFDIEEFHIADLFKKCIETIDQVHQDSGIIYVHCNAGVSRSPTIVAAYLMQNSKINSTEAINKIKLIRPKINPNPGFLKQLRDFEKLIN